jgi:hypothetical protein
VRKPLTSRSDRNIFRERGQFEGEEKSPQLGQRYNPPVPAKVSSLPQGSPASLYTKSSQRHPGVPNGFGQNPTPNEITNDTLNAITTYAVDPRQDRDPSGKFKDQLIENPSGKENDVQVEQSPINGLDQSEGAQTKKGRVRYNLLSYILH